MLSKDASEFLVEVIINHVPKERIPKLLEDLKSNSAGNKSYNDTIARVEEIIGTRIDVQRSG